MWWLQDCRRLPSCTTHSGLAGALQSAQSRGPRCGRYAGHQRCHLNAWDHGMGKVGNMCDMGCKILMWCMGVLYSSIGVVFFGQPEVRSGIFRSYMSKAIIRAPLMRWFGQAQGKLWSQCSAREIGALVCFTWIREPGADGVTFVNRRSMIARLARRSMTKSGLFACEF